jgi:hypothetical protein
MPAYNSGGRAIGWRSQTAAYQVNAAELDGDICVLLDVVPATAAANNVATTTSSTSLVIPIAGALVTSGVAVMDVPRNLVAAWTTTSVLTFTGTDAYGVVIHEASASGTSHTGSKAFATVTAITCTIDVTGCTVGTGQKIGFPRFLNRVNDIIVVKFNNVLAADASTVVAGVTTTATTTTGDVRGTISASASWDGTKMITVFGRPPRVYTDAGQFGVTQA